MGSSPKSGGRVSRAGQRGRSHVFVCVCVCVIVDGRWAHLQSERRKGTSSLDASNPGPVRADAPSRLSTRSTSSHLPPSYMMVGSMGWGWCLVPCLIGLPHSPGLIFRGNPTHREKKESRLKNGIHRYEERKGKVTGGFLSGGGTLDVKVRARRGERQERTIDR